MTPVVVLARPVGEFPPGWLATEVGRQVARLNLPATTDIDTPKEKAA